MYIMIRVFWLLVSLTSDLTQFFAMIIDKFVQLINVCPVAEHQTVQWNNDQKIVDMSVIGYNDYMRGYAMHQKACGVLPWVKRCIHKAQCYRHCPVHRQSCS